MSHINDQSVAKVQHLNSLVEFMNVSFSLLAFIPVTKNN